MKSKDNRGARMDSCGTPLVTGFKDDLLSSMRTYCCLFVKYDFIVERSFAPMRNKILWGSVESFYKIEI